MLADLTPIVARGIIDNTTRDTIKLTLWFAREQEPLHLELPGNCLRDIAGCRVEFHQEAPPYPLSRQLALHKLLKSIRTSALPFIAGDVTLSRRMPSSIRPQMLSNQLSIEFFQGADTRFLIEGEMFEYEVSLPAWECTRALENMQEIVNMSALHDHVVLNVARFRGPSLSQLGEDMPPCAWDAVLNQAEAYMSIVTSVHEKYATHPRGRLAEAFVLDQLDFLHEKAEQEERGELYYSSQSKMAWEVTDFMTDEHAALVEEAMKHPLFETTGHISGLMQKHIIAELPRYRDNREIDTMLSLYSGIISHTLATLLLSTEQRAAAAKLAADRAKILGLRMEKLKRFTTSLPPKVREKFLHGMDAFLSELKNFVFTLRK